VAVGRLFRSKPAATTRAARRSPTGARRPNDHRRSSPLSLLLRTTHRLRWRRRSNSNNHHSSINSNINRRSPRVPVPGSPCWQLSRHFRARPRRLTTKTAETASASRLRDDGLAWGTIASHGDQDPANYAKNTAQHHQQHSMLLNPRRRWRRDWIGSSDAWAPLGPLQPAPNRRSRAYESG